MIELIIKSENYDFHNEEGEPAGRVQYDPQANNYDLFMLFEYEGRYDDEYLGSVKNREKALELMTKILEADFLPNV